MQEKNGKTPFNIRIDSELHLKLLERKKLTHLTFNKQIEEALKLYFDKLEDNNV
jgi:predicted HicB family RNase H-like nuclease